MLPVIVEAALLAARSLGSPAKGARAGYAAAKSKAAESVRSTLAWSSLLQAFYIDFGHLKHGLHGALGFFGIFVAESFAESGGDDLPGEAEFVFEPAASAGFSAGGKFFPEVVDFRLRFAVDEEGYGFGEGKLGTAVQGHEGLSFEFKGCGHDGSLGSRAGFTEASDFSDS